MLSFSGQAVVSFVGWLEVAHQNSTFELAALGNFFDVDVERKLLTGFQKFIPPVWGVLGVYPGLSP